MLGNDVVDLRDPETRTRHPGFDARVFTRAERCRLMRVADPHAMRQMLWAAKESAYKAARRIDPGTVFSPVRFEVERLANGIGCVRHASARFRIALQRDGDCLHAVATHEHAQALPLLGVAVVHGRDPGRVARSLAVAGVSRALGVGPGALAVRRRGRIPELHLEGSPLPAPLSLSHHGRFAAYAALATAPATGTQH